LTKDEEFIVSGYALKEAQEAMQAVIPLYPEAIGNIRTATETLLDRENWIGAARNEFKATFRIVDHYLEDDTQRISSLVEIVKGFREIYDALDVESAKKIYDALTSDDA